MNLSDILGSSWARLGASLIDSLILLVPLALIAGIIGAAGEQAPGAGALVLLWLVFVLGYAPVLMARKGPNNGQTIGKQMLNVRAVHQSGIPMTFGKAAMRELVGKWLPGLLCGLYGLLDSLWLLWDDRRQTLHDKIGKTYVLKAEADLAWAPQLAAPIGAQVRGGWIAPGQQSYGQQYGSPEQAYGQQPYGQQPPPPPPPPPPSSR